MNPILFDALVFDLGGVLVDWNPRYLYRPLFAGDDAAMEDFLARVCPPEWNLEMDAGRPFAEAVAERQRLFPEHAHHIALWHTSWPQMLRDQIPETVELLAALRDRGHRLVALTNWSAETFPIARRRFPFLDWFEDIVVSGEVKLAKPDPRIFELHDPAHRAGPGTHAVHRRPGPQRRRCPRRGLSHAPLRQPGGAAPGTRTARFALK